MKYPVRCERCTVVIGYTTRTPKENARLAALGRFHPICWDCRRRTRIRPA